MRCEVNLEYIQYTLLYGFQFTESKSSFSKQTGKGGEESGQPRRNSLKCNTDHPFSVRSYSFFFFFKEMHILREKL